MKETQIFFKGPMVRAILDGRKTMTRRPIEPQPHISLELGDTLKTWIYDPNGTPRIALGWRDVWSHPDMELSGSAIFHYGKKGDRLWVRETFKLANNFNGLSPTDADRYVQVWYKSDGSRRYDETKAKPGNYWRPSIYMFKEYARIWLEITNVRVERLQDISEEDAIAEGSQIPCDQLPKSCRQGTLTERTQFSRIWDSIYGKKYPWSDNPWVWVIEFKRITISGE